MNIFDSRMGWLVVLCFAVALPGCSGGGGGKGKISGTVTLDGQPLAEGTITFSPVDGNAATAGGKITAGKYSVETASQGNQRVVINSAKVVGQRKRYEGDPNSPVMDITEEILPKKYSDPVVTELTAEVKGDTAQDFSLNSK